MNKSTTPLALAIFAIALVIWVLTEVVARGLGRAKVKDRPWAQFGLHVFPLLLGVIVVSCTSLLTFSMDMFGYMPKSPPDTGDLVLLGLLAGAAAVLAHDKIGKFLRHKFPIVFDEGKKSSPEHLVQAVDEALLDKKPPILPLLLVLLAPFGFMGCVKAEYVIEREVRFVIKRSPLDIRMMVDGQERCRATDPHGSATLRFKIDDLRPHLEGEATP